MMLVALVPHSEVLGKVLLREEALTGFRGWFALDSIYRTRHPSPSTTHHHPNPGPGSSSCSTLVEVYHRPASSHTRFSLWHWRVVYHQQHAGWTHHAIATRLETTAHVLHPSQHLPLVTLLQIALKPGLQSWPWSRPPRLSSLVI